MTLPNNNSNETLRIGFVPLVDCAPIAVAQEQGYFVSHGLNVSLSREPGWASIRDKLAYGELDAAHALVGLAFALSAGVGVVKTPALTGFLLNSNGDAITLATHLCGRGVTTPEALLAEAKSPGRSRPITLGVPHTFSTHHFLLRQWLRPAGMKDYQPEVNFLVLPPSQMPGCLASGSIDGYCVGEPYNTLAVKNGTGKIVAESSALSPLHPEKALIVTERFAETRPEEHMELIRCSEKAARFCEAVDGRKEAATLLARPEYLGLDREIIESSLLSQNGEVKPSGFHVFHHEDVNRPTPDKANWTIAQLRLAGLLDGTSGKKPPSPSRVFRADLFDEALQLSR